MGWDLVSGRRVSRRGTAIDHHLTLARVQSLSDNLRVIPAAAFCNRKENRFVTRQHFRPAVAALFLAFRHRLRRTAAGGHLQQSGTGIWCEDDVVVRAPDRAARTGTAIAQRSEEHTSELQSHSFISYAV